VLARGDAAAISALLIARVRAFRRQDADPRGAITWDWLVAQARRGDYDMLCDTLTELPDGELRRAHHLDLANLIRDVMSGRLKRPRHRVRLSLQSRAYLHNKQYLGERIVVARLREVERRRGKGLRGAEREAVIRDLIKKIKFKRGRISQRPTSNSVAQFLRRGKSRR
jgi:hypothetical protein